METHKDNHTHTGTLLNILKNIPPTGLDTHAIAHINELSGGFAHHIGMRFTDITPEYVRAELPVGHHHLQPAGLVNGGVLSSLGETVGSIMGIIAAGGAVVVGVNNNTDFFQSVSAGVITAIARIVHAGKTTQVIEITMLHGEKKIAATHLRTFVLTRMPTSGN